jgi:hypothetical protein
MTGRPLDDYVGDDPAIVPGTEVQGPVNCVGYVDAVHP